MRAEQRAPEIFVVDDDRSVRDTLSLVFKLEGYQVTGFGEGTSLFAAARTRVPACILLDMDLPGRSGLDILKELHAQHYPAPVVVISGKRQIATVVDAIRHGAVDFIEKPFETETVAGRVREAIGSLALRDELRTTFDVLALGFPGSERLTRRECEVLARVSAGATSKAAGRHLGISSRTVEVHRARVMRKLGAKNAADLMRIVLGGSYGH